MLELNELPERLFKWLREMNEEATNPSFFLGAQFPTRLRLLSADPIPNRTPNGRRTNNRFEGSWRDELIGRISGEGNTVRLTPRYPTGEFADIGIELPSGEELWLEIVGAWRIPFKLSGRR